MKKNLSPFKFIPLLALTLLLLGIIQQQGVLSADAPVDQIDDDWTGLMLAMAADRLPPENLEPMSAEPCIDGLAGGIGGYPCKNVDLLAFMPLSTFNLGEANDSWGWTDPQTGREYVLLGLQQGTAFVDISDPINPLYLGHLPSHTGSSTWRDIKVYANHAFVVSEASNHGLQIFDLTQLPDVVSPPVTFSETAYYNNNGGSQPGDAHNLVINEASGYAYMVGSDDCAGGLHMVNIQDPLNPTFAGCFSAAGYTHDAQCVSYAGPDPDHQGSEICFNANGSSAFVIADVTDKNNPVALASETYSGLSYVHQGWLTEDHTYFLQGDELDESNFGHNTRTRIWDVSDLDNPLLIGYFDGRTPAIDHNLYTHNGYAYEANYRSGISILQLGDVANGELIEYGYFDIYTTSNGPEFNGAWNIYPYHSNNVISVSGIEQGLYLLRLQHLSYLPLASWGN